MGEIADLRARALDNLAVGVDELVHLRRERRHILRELPGDTLGLAAPDRGDSVAKRAKRAQAVADGERGRSDQRQRQRQKRRRQSPFEAMLLRLDHVGVGRDLKEVAPLVAGVDLAFDRPERVSAGPDDIAAQDRAVIRSSRDEAGELCGEQGL